MILGIMVTSNERVVALLKYYRGEGRLQKFRSNQFLFFADLRGSFDYLHRYHRVWYGFAFAAFPG